MSNEVIQAYQDAATGILPGLKIVIMLMWGVIASTFALMAVGTWASLRHLWKSCIRDYKRRHDAQDLEEQVIRDKWDNFHDALDDFKDGVVGVLRSCHGWFHGRKEAFDTWRRVRREKKEEDRVQRTLERERISAERAEALQVQAEIEAEMPKRYHWMQRFWLWLNEALLEKAVEMAKAEIREEIRIGCNEAVSTATWNQLVDSGFADSLPEEPEEEPVAITALACTDVGYVVRFRGGRSNWSYLITDEEFPCNNGRIDRIRAAHSDNANSIRPSALVTVFGCPLEAWKAHAERLAYHEEKWPDSSALDRIRAAEVILLSEAEEQEERCTYNADSVRKYIDDGLRRLEQMRLLEEFTFNQLRKLLSDYNPELAQTKKGRNKPWILSRIYYYLERDQANPWLPSLIRNR